LSTSRDIPPDPARGGGGNDEQLDEFAGIQSPPFTSAASCIVVPSPPIARQWALAPLAWVFANKTFATLEAFL
jgi:hypothetical protein